jgi:D-alanyl-D-alanine carboxypeptidase
MERREPMIDIRAHVNAYVESGFSRIGRVESGFSRILSLVALLVCLVATVSAVAQQKPDPNVRARIDAFVNALASGDEARYEAMARENFAPEFLEARTAEQRRQFVARVRTDFGKPTVSTVRTNDGEHFSLAISGSTGTKAEIRLTLEPAAPRRITSISVEIGGGAEDETGGLAPPPIDGTMDAARLSKALDEYLSRLSAADAFAGTVLVARDGLPLYVRAYGEANREAHTVNAPATRFNLGSINKIFTKTAVAQLVSQGKLARTDTVGKLLPDYPNAQAKTATIDQLLEHQAGIADFFGPAFQSAPKTGFRSNADYYRFVAPQPLLFEPGTRRQYCNGCYVVLGAIIERVSGMPYEQYVSERIFKPAGMKGAGFFHADRLPADTATGYTKRAPDANGAIRPNIDLHGAAGSAAGGAYASGADLLAFDNALREHRLLDAKMTAWLLDEDEAAGTRARGGLGIAGGAPGINAVLESDGTWTVVVLGNLDPPTAERLGVAIRRRLAGAR